MESSWHREDVERVFRSRWRGSFNEVMGFEVLEARRGFARVGLPVRPALFQPNGVVHGGVLAALADTAGGVGSYASYPVGTEVMTVEMKVNFLRPASGGVLVGEARALHLGRRTSAWEIRVLGAEERLACFASATYMVVKSA